MGEGDAQSPACNRAGLPFQRLVAAVLVFLIHGATGAEMPKPAFTTPAFTPGVNHRSDLCDIQNKVLNGTVALSDSLKGLSLSFTFVETPVYAEVAGGKLSSEGIHVELSDEVARRAGFEWRSTYALLTPPTGDQTWTDLLIYMVKHYDVSVDWYYHTVQRMDMGVSFPEGWYDGSLILIVNSEESPPSLSDTLFSWVRPFGCGLMQIAVWAHGKM